MSACKDCKYLEWNKDRSSVVGGHMIPNDEPIWHELYCGHPKVRTRGGFNPFTGKQGPPEKPHIREINHGDCGYFEPKELNHYLGLLN